MSPPPTTSRLRTRSPQGKGGRLRDELISAADRVLASTVDASGISLRAVAREAGVAAPSVYLHFSSKVDLVCAVKRAHFAALQEQIGTATTGAIDPIGRLRAGCLAYCHFAVDKPGSYRILFGTDSLTLADSTGELGLGIGPFALFVEAVADCIKSGT
jgi:AcrR family transcriptional regulator